MQHTRGRRSRRGRRLCQQSPKSRRREQSHRTCAATCVGPQPVRSGRAPSQAQAQWRGWGWGVGGFALGALAGAAIARSTWGYPGYYGYGYPAYGYGYAYPSYGYGNGPAYGVSYSYSYPAYYGGYYRPYYGYAYAGPRVVRRVVVHRARWR